jgi:hypothetical protein
MVSHSLRGALLPISLRMAALSMRTAAGRDHTAQISCRSAGVSQSICTSVRRCQLLRAALSRVVRM